MNKQGNLQSASLNLTPIQRTSSLSRDIFQEAYVKPLKPVIITDYNAHWPAKEKWTIDYFKKTVGDLKVPLYGQAFANSGKSYMQPSQIMRFADYLDLIISESTQLRMFLFNIFSHFPSLCNDFDYPPLVDYYLTKYPFMFFGGRGSFVDAHYDVDLAHVFLTQFMGKRRVILFSIENSVNLYRHPFTVSTNIDLGNPDFKKYPRLSQAKGFECILNANETLFIPSGYWHYIYYLEGGFGLSLRSPHSSLITRYTGYWNIIKLYLDQNITQLLGSKWGDLKEKMAIKRSEKAEK